MLKGLSKAGIGTIDEKDFIRLASLHGFDAIDTDGTSLVTLIEENGLEQANALLQENHIKIGTFGLSVQWRTTEDEFKSGLKQLVAEAEAATALGCTSCITYILPSTDFNAAEFMAVATRRLRTCAQILGCFGIQLGLEFVGPHHLRTRWANPFIWDMNQTLSFIEAIGEKNVGLLVDSYHCYTNGMTNDDLTQLKAHQIVHVHINDAKDIPVEDLLDNDRLYPGEGVIDLVGFLLALKQVGYTGPVSQEILTQSPPIEYAEVLVKKSAELYQKLFKAAGM
ncbi:sugar phosphate isomerase/epimerase family protein [Bacillus alkalicellulosilyticus]|uniref:sugar phosphate isomerase/epimerase family protein n=1 Tax=Alkalihalobacterium alkalicellulosilyticum TaxID=1912214 RepID=UPI000998C9A4|nr:sugar phosphate isomerase/epimerase family protein [Bacillus alkalicellulosilyticus]